MKKAKNFYTLGISIICVFIIMHVLYIGASIAVPFVIALFLSISILAISGTLQKFNLPKPISIVISIFIHVFIVLIITKIITTNIDNLRQQIPFYQSRYYEVITSIAKQLGLEPNILESSIINSIKFDTILGYLILLGTNFVRNAGTIFFFTVFILIESRFFPYKIKKISSNKNLFVLYEHIKNDIKGYFVIKTLISFFTAFITFVFLSLFEIDFALFWSFLVFCLNYIPTLGSIIAVIFPSIFSILQFGDWGLTVSLLVLLSIIQMYFGNYLEPKLQGTRLNLSPLVIILSLLIWGKMRGIMGMLLCVPIMVIVNIILSYFPRTQWLAILMSERGNIRNVTEKGIPGTDFTKQVVVTLKQTKNKVFGKK